MSVELVPRWLWQEVTVPQSGEVIIDPSNFANTTQFPMRLHWLSICGKPATNGAPYDDSSGGVVRRLNVEVGISGYSDVNLVPMVGTAFFATDKFIQKDFPASTGDSLSRNTGASVYLPRAIRIPSDGGLSVEVENTSVEASAIVCRQPSIVAHGYYDWSKMPGFLAGRLNENLTVGGPRAIDASDLLNKGREDFIVTDISVDAFSTIQTGLEVGEITQYPYLTNISWRINPVSGIEWMPNPSPIPVGCIAPFTRTLDLSDVGPKVYRISRNTALMPRQRLGIKLTDVSAAEQQVNICLHGELEVQ